jgi:hypothetical protein
VPPNVSPRLLERQRLNRIGTVETACSAHRTVKLGF